MEHFQQRCYFLLFLLGVGQKNDMFRINALTGSKVAQFISEQFGTNNIEIGQKLWLRQHLL